MRRVRIGLLAAWLALLCSLFFDPFTTALTNPTNTSSPFHVTDEPVMVQGERLWSEPYSMVHRIFWTMVLPLVPLTLMLLGHETWRRVCPLSHVSQIPRMLGLERKIKKLDRRSGRVDRVLALLPTESWLRKNHLLFQFGFLSLGVLGRILFYNSDHLALAVAFVFIMGFALLVGFAYGGKTWCNYFCPTAVIQAIYTGPGGLFDSKAHVSRLPVSQSVCRAPGRTEDRSTCVGCTTHCPDLDLENSYWKNVTSDQKQFMYYGFFGLVFAFYTYYYVYSGSWDYYMSGYWTHEAGQLQKLLGPGFYIGGTAIPIPKLIAAPMYFATCIAASFGLFALAEQIYRRLLARAGQQVSKARLRHRMLTISAFLSFNLFYVFAGRPNIHLMPPWAIKLIDVIIIAVAVAWIFKSLSRDADHYRREHLGDALRRELVRMGFHSEDLLEGRPIEQLTADEVYVLAKTLPNFGTAQKRETYRAILADAIETGQAKSSDSLKLLGDLRAQLGLSDSDHQAILHTLGVEDPSLLDPEVAHSVELKARRGNYRRFLLDLMQRGLSAGVSPSQYLASTDAAEAIAPVRAVFGILDDEHASIIAEVTGDTARLTEREQKLFDSLRDIESMRFVLSRDRRPEALLINHALLSRQKLVIRELISLAVSVGDYGRMSELTQAIDVVVGSAARPVLIEALDAAPAIVRDAFQQQGSSVPTWSYLDIVESSRPPEHVFRTLLRETDPLVAALATSALLTTNAAESKALAVERLAVPEEVSPLAENVLVHVARGERSEMVGIAAELVSAPVFSALDLSKLAEIALQSELVTFSAGDQICRAGESPSAMFVLVRGETAAWIERESRRVELGRGKAGAVFGELGVITGRPRSASIEVTSPLATVISIPRATVDDLLGRDLAAARGILKVVSGYLIDSLSTVTAQRLHSASDPVPAQ